ncbi:hypothetical protein ACFVU2_19740 [Leifsonia sp. NPDC058194]|uniref:hypothetical protein n=1 Tax=Leifsonia sp. NPDC058194 TaxID=3346374 RepID=UPI0036D998B7
MRERWNPFAYEYTPIKNRLARAAVALSLLPLVAIYWAVLIAHGSLQRLLERLWS